MFQGYEVGVLTIMERISPGASFRSRCAPELIGASVSEPPLSVDLCVRA